MQEIIQEKFMRTVKEIKIAIISVESKFSNIAEKILEIPGIESIYFENDSQLPGIIKRLKERGCKAKEVIVIKNFNGRFFEICPGSPKVICCNYRLINTGFNCLYNCTYCYLQYYLNSYGIMLFSNFENCIIELENFAANSDSDRVYRIGTGEYTDSLMIDEVTGYSTMLINAAKNHANIMLELKTKSSCVDHLLAIREKGNAVVAWSLNTDKNIAEYEADTASLDERLLAAKKCADNGYFIAFHFDPIIIYDNWKNDYAGIIKRIFTEVNPDKVVWISLGGFRYSANFKDIIMNAFPGEKLTAEELFPGLDGKYRYLKQIRIDMYKFMKERILSYSDKVFVYMCMESADVWQQVFGKNYENSFDLETDFSEKLKDNFLH